MGEIFSGGLILGRKILAGRFFTVDKKISGPPDSQFYVKQLHKVNISCGLEKTLLGGITFCAVGLFLGAVLA